MSHFTFLISLISDGILFNTDNHIELKVKKIIKLINSYCCCCEILKPIS